MFYVKLESSYCRIHCAFRFGSINRELGSTDRKSSRIFFLQNFQAYITCRVLCFALGIKRKPWPHFLGCSNCCVCESLVRSRGGCLHTCLGLSRRRIHWKLNDHSVAALKRLKIRKRECLYLLGIQERRSLWSRSYHMVVVVSFLHEVAIGY